MTQNKNKQQWLRLYRLLERLMQDERNFVSSSEIAWLYNRWYPDYAVDKLSVFENLKFFKKLGLVDQAKWHGHTESKWRLKRNATPNNLVIR